MEAVDWPFMLAIVSALTMTVGNLAALPQQNVKRLLAYSSIAHGGYLLMGGVLLTSEGIGAILFYLVVYLFMNLGAFYVVVLVANEVGSEMVDGYRGLSSRAPLVAVGNGDFSRFSPPEFRRSLGSLGNGSFSPLSLSKGYYWLAFVGLLNSVVSLYYYARIVKAMFLEDAGEETDRVSFSTGTFALLSVFVIPTIFIGFLNIFYTFSNISVSVMPMQ